MNIINSSNKDALSIEEIRDLIKLLKQQEPFSNKALLTLKEMAIYLNISETQARQILHKPYNPFLVRLGNRYYANKKLLDKWIDQISGTGIKI